MAKTINTAAEEVQEAAIAVQEPSPYDMVEILISRHECNSDEGHFVGINGRTYLIPKNKPTMVPRYVADEIRRCRMAQVVADERIDNLAWKVPERVSVN